MNEWMNEGMNEFTTIDPFLLFAVFCRSGAYSGRGRSYITQADKAVMGARARATGSVTDSSRTLIIGSGFPVTLQVST